MKRYKTGLVIGKFLPLHKGHIALMQEASRNSDQLTIIVCHTSTYTIPAKIRKQWIENEFPNADVRILKHGKRLDSTSTSVSKEWAEVTSRFLGFTPEVVYSSEEYAVEYAKWLGSKHEMFDLNRGIVPICATQIREDPYEHWDMLNSDVKAFYAIRIVVLGAESTGTTTLAKDLAKSLNTVWVPEYGRIYSEGKLHSKNSLQWNEDEFVHIAQMQNALEDKLAGKCEKFLICDTDSFATSIWYTRYLNKRSSKVEELSQGRNYSLYVLTGDEIPFVQDGTRDGEHIRHTMHTCFEQRLKETGKNYVVVRGSREERLKKALAYVLDTLTIDG